MYVKGVRLKNWMRYGGEHRLELQPTVYGIVGEWLGEDGRSNWSGKSTLVEALPFALFGEHRHRTEDEWITNGEDEGGVELTLSNGVVLSRSRERGKATKIRVGMPGKDVGYTGKEAEAFIAQQVLGCTRDEFYLLYFVKQKELAQMVMMKPEQFADTIRQWVGTAPLERVEEEASRELARCSEKVRELEQTILAATSDAISGTVNSDGSGVLDPVVEIGRMLDRANSAHEQAEANVVAARAALKNARAGQEEASEWYRHKAHVDALAGTRARAKLLETELAATDKVTVELEVQDADTADQISATQAARLQTMCANLEELARGTFNGTCPATSAACPAREHVLKIGMQNREKVPAARDNAARARERRVACRNVLTAAQERLRGIERSESQLQEFRAILEDGAHHQTYVVEHAEPCEPERYANEVVSAEGTLSTARIVARDAEQEVTRLTRRLDEVTRALANIADAKLVMNRYLRIRRAAGRQGAQREIALGSMRRVEQLGNTMMSDAGIGLSFRVRWTSEGKKLSSTCDACGHAFIGQRDKACPRCKAERGLHGIDRPGLEMSECSGAAEDLVGGSVRFGASAWLRRKRTMPWGSAVVDEPFGSLDTANREAFAQYLVSSLRGRFGFEQAFIIAHHEEVMSQMPGRIRVVGTQHGSRCEVVY